MRLTRMLVAALLLGLVAGGSALGQGIEKKEITIAVGGKVALYYLPLTIAEAKGYFKDAGLDARVLDFKGGSQSVQAVVGGSADILSSAFEHTINIQARGQELTAFVLQGRYPGFALSLATGIADKYKSPADLKGLKIGVTAPGSSTHAMVKLLLTKVGLKDDDIAVIGVGAGASVLAAIEQKHVDGVVQADPATTLLTSRGLAVVKVDTRTAAGTTEVYGGPMPAASISALGSFISQNPTTVQAVTNAMVRALHFLNTASDAEILAAIPPEMLLGGDEALYLKLVKAVRPSYSPDGLISKEAAETALKVLQDSNPAVRDAKIDLAKTYTNKFVQAVPKQM